MTWTYRQGARHNVPPNVAAAEVERIQTTNGVLTASALVEESEDPNAPCHKEFDWNDRRAAHKYRLVQARKLIRDLVFIEPRTKEPLQFYHVPSQNEEGHYEFVKRLINVRTEYQAALGELLQKLEGLEESVQRLLRAAKGSKSSTVRNILNSVATTIASARAALQSLPQDDDD